FFHGALAERERYRRRYDGLGMLTGYRPIGTAGIRRLHDVVDAPHPFRRNAGRANPLFDLGVGPATRPGGDRFVDLVVMAHPADRGREALVATEFGPAQHAGQ